MVQLASNLRDNWSIMSKMKPPRASRSGTCVPKFGAMGSTSFFGFSYPNLILVFLNLIVFRNFFIYFIFLPVLVFLYSIFVCDSASEFGAMGSTSFELYQFLFSPYNSLLL